MAVGLRPLAKRRLKAPGGPTVEGEAGLATRSAAWIAAKAIQGLVFGVVSSDPMTFGGVVVLVAIVAALAGYTPATRVSPIDLVLALRSE